MGSFEGLVFIKQGLIGTRSEGPDYYLQTKDHEYLLERKTQELHFEPDFLLEFYCRKWVEIKGDLAGNKLTVKTIVETCAGRMK